MQERELTERLLARVDAVLATMDAVPPDLAADVEVARAMAAMQREDFEAYLRHSEARRDAHRAAGDVRGFCEASNSLGFACLIVGSDALGEAVLREGIEAAERLGLRREAAACRSNLSLILLRRGQLDDALAEVRTALTSVRELGESSLLTSAELDYAEILLVRGELDTAEEAARTAHAHAERSPTHHVYAAAVLASVLLPKKKLEEALVLAEWAYGRRAELLLRDAADLQIDLAYGRALHAVGREAEADRVLAEARDKVLARAARFADPTLRASFLRVPENAEVLAFVAQPRT
jgi:tetratricopeptide (TPR) repeat protein